MNIDYAKIIQTANARRGALQAFEAAVTILKDELSAVLGDTVPALTEFHRCYKALDQEAQNLLPKDCAYVLDHFTGSLLERIENIDRPSAYCNNVTPRAALEKLTT